MSCLWRSNPCFSLLLLLPFSFFISSTFFSFSNASPHVHHVKTVQLSEVVNGDEYNGIITWKTRRSVAEAADNPSKILAGNRTCRRDPLDGFKKYNGGWDIQNKHYWASVGFTAAPLFAIAAAWLVIFGLTLCCICIYSCCRCCREKRSSYSRTCHNLSIIFISLCTYAAIGGCIFLYMGQGKFNSSVTNTLDYVVSQASMVVSNLGNVSVNFLAAKNLGESEISLPQDLQNNIGGLQSNISTFSSDFSHKAEEASKRIKGAFKRARMALVVVAAAVLLLAFIGFLLSMLGARCLVYTLVLLGWLLVTVTFVLCGGFLLLHNAVGDMCVSMEEWGHHPTVHTTLDDVLPCMDRSDAEKIVTSSKDITRHLVNSVDALITEVANGNFTSGALLNYNQSGPFVPLLCNPYNKDGSSRTCASGEVDFKNATEVWKGYVCQVSSGNTCSTTGRLKPKQFEQMNTVINITYSLSYYTPFLVSLADCSFLRQIFRDLSTIYCPGLSKYLGWIYVGLTIDSAAVMFSLIFLVIYGKQRRRHANTNQFILKGGSRQKGY
ncbi:hypothetical protein Ancab_006780 [Ancistrocladus abbreviatus]